MTFASSEIYIDIGATTADRSVSLGQGTLEYEVVDIGPSSLFADGKAEVTASSLVFHVDANRPDYPVGNT